MALRARKSRARLSLPTAAIAAQRSSVKETRKRKQYAGLFYGFWTDPTNGQRLGRASRVEIAIAYRLRSDHSDIRTGQVKVA
jgi:hypothetical protein